MAMHMCTGKWNKLGGLSRGRRELGRVEAHRAVERLVVLDVELQLQAGEILLRQMLQTEVWLK